MPSKKPSQEQQTDAPFSPSVPVIPGLEAWRHLVEGQMAMVDSALSVVTRLEPQGTQRTVEAVDAYTELVKQSLRYASEGAAEWRKLMRDTLRRSTETVSQPASG